jgi:hypothetical protein
MSQQNHQNLFIINTISVRAGSRAGQARRCGERIKQGLIRHLLRAQKPATEADVALECGSGGVMCKAQMQPDLFGATLRIAPEQEAAR